jgi:hypothetical protein
MRETKISGNLKRSAALHKRSGGGATSSLDPLKRALFHNALSCWLVSLVVCLAWVFPGRMTGGGVFVASENMSVTTNGGTDAFRVTHAFETLF